MITKLVAGDVRSYKQLPLTLYQIQTKFRDEIRPRFGILRAREFLMKDAYSFHTDRESLQETYDLMFAAYQRIFTRLGLDFRAVIADSGSIGGTGSHEFHVLSESGEDEIAYSDGSDYAANLEKAETLAGGNSSSGSVTVNLTIVNLSEHGQVILLVAADDSLNEIKAGYAVSGDEMVMLSEAAVAKALAAGSLAQLELPMIADHRLEGASEFIYHVGDSEQRVSVTALENINFADLRNVREGDASQTAKVTYI